MKCRAIFAISALLLGGCATQPIDLKPPIELIGVVTDPVFTGWFRDFCGNEQVPVSDLDCVQVGGEIYRATLLHARTLSGEKVARKLTIGFVAHALPRSYRQKWRVHLSRSPDDFMNATGIAYLAWDWE